MQVFFVAWSSRRRQVRERARGRWKTTSERVCTATGPLGSCTSLTARLSFSLVSHDDLIFVGESTSSRSSRCCHKVCDLTLMISNRFDSILLLLRKSVLRGVAGFIIITEFCERLAYYGFAGSLVLFFQTQMNYSNATADIQV